MQEQASFFLSFFSPGNTAQKLRLYTVTQGGGNSNPGHRSDGVTCAPASLGRLPRMPELGAPHAHRPLISLLHSTLSLSRIIQSSWQHSDWSRSILVPSRWLTQSDWWTWRTHVKMYIKSRWPTLLILFFFSSSSIHVVTLSSNFVALHSGSCCSSVFGIIPNKQHLSGRAFIVN